MVKHSVNKIHRYLTNVDESGNIVNAEEITKTRTFVQHFVAGAIAGFGSCIIIAPFDRLKVYRQVVKTRVALRPLWTAPSYFKAMQKSFSIGGFSNVYRGFSIAIISYAPYCGLELASYERMKNLYVSYTSALFNRGPEPKLRMLEIFSLACTATVVPIFLFYPIKMFRHRYQSHIGPVAPSLWFLGKQTLLRGRKRLYQGCIAQMWKSAPSTGTSYLIYELVLEKQNNPGLGT